MASRSAATVTVYIGAAFWFTTSTSFANLAVVFGRMFSDSFAGIAPVSAIGFMLAQLVGAALGTAIHDAHILLVIRTSLRTPARKASAWRSEFPLWHRRPGGR